MKTLSRYEYQVTVAILRLYNQGVRDPSIAEITCETFGQARPQDPLFQPDSLGGELYNGVLVRMPKLRRWLEERHDLLTTPINATYYALGLRDNQPTEDQVHASMPHGGLQLVYDANHEPKHEGNGTAGIRIVKADDNDPFFVRYLEHKGMIAASTLHRTGKQAVKVTQIGAAPVDVTRAMLGKLDQRIGTQPSKLLGNGEDATH